MQIQKKNTGADDPASSAPSAQKFLSIARPQIDDLLKSVQQIKKEKKTIKICHCGSRGCNIGPFEYVAVEV
jgi:hypothetical protein